MSRREELAANLAELRGRIVDACVAASRDSDDVTLVAVTKTWPASDVRVLAELGVTDIGENRDQEASAKARQCADLDVTWHFVGQLQTNKCRSVAAYADVVHSVDRGRLAVTLGAEARRRGRVLECLVQVDLHEGGGEERRPGGGGVAPEGVNRLADIIADTEGVAVAGVMGMAPWGADPATAFGLLTDVGERLRKIHPDATMVSGGMSGDLESAIAHGATHLRVGTALLGPRSVDVR